MHHSSFETMRRLAAAYIKHSSTVLDVGGADVNGSYRSLFDGCTYRSLDFVSADIVVTGYDWPIEDGSYDAVVSGQALEHDPMFWLTLTNITRVLRPGGHAVIIVPSGGPVHRHPVDCYRFNPDALDGWAKWTGMTLVEKHQDAQSNWRDLAGVFRKSPA